MADGLFVDMRRFAVPPGRAQGAEPFERRPRPMRARRLARRWLARWQVAEAEPVALASYLAPREDERRWRGMTYR